MKKLGLALGGGGLKGLAHIGVLQILQENQIPIAQISGTSIGSVIAALYAYGISPYEMEEIALDLKISDYIDYNLSGIVKHIISLYIPGYKATLDGFIKGNKLECLMNKLTSGKEITDIKMPLSIIACDIDTGREIVFSNQDLLLNETQMLIKKVKLSEAVRASSSIPVTFVPFSFHQSQLVDGGVREIVPVGVQYQMGAEYILAVNLGQEIYDQPVKGIFQIINRTLSILIFETSKENQETYADMAIYPNITNVNITDVDKAAEIIRSGRRAMKNHIEDLKWSLK
ncbi:MAG TPA: patatin-like phospholipase family protein [Syntrophomonadaceae bacterium]|nr:patatin-like phospholipase family protein [Syntrophomonadaceae bacterium]